MADAYVHLSLSAVAISFVGNAVTTWHSCFSFFTSSIWVECCAFGRSIMCIISQSQWTTPVRLDLQRWEITRIRAHTHTIPTGRPQPFELVNMLTVGQVFPVSDLEQMCCQSDNGQYTVRIRIDAHIFSPNGEKGETFLWENVTMINWYEMRIDTSRVAMPTIKLNTFDCMWIYERSSLCVCARAIFWRSCPTHAFSMHARACLSTWNWHICFGGCERTSVVEIRVGWPIKVWLRFARRIIFAVCTKIENVNSERAKIRFIFLSFNRHDAARKRFRHGGERWPIIELAFRLTNGELNGHHLRTMSNKYSFDARRRCGSALEWTRPG